MLYIVTDYMGKHDMKTGGLERNSEVIPQYQPAETGSHLFLPLNLRD